jgi:hypothetical protein
MPRILPFYPLLRSALVDQLPAGMYSETRKDVMMEGVADVKEHQAGLAGIAQAQAGHKLRHGEEGRRGME